jgi:hypothetical protein
MGAVLTFIIILITAKKQLIFYFSPAEGGGKVNLNLFRFKQETVSAWQRQDCVEFQHRFLLLEYPSNK